MALAGGPLCAGDRGNTVAQRAPRGGLSPPASALASVSGDSALVARPEASHPAPPLRQAARPGARSPPRSGKGRPPWGRRRGRAARFSPYPAPGAARDLLRGARRRDCDPAL